MKLIRTEWLDGLKFYLVQLGEHAIFLSKEEYAAAQHSVQLTALRRVWRVGFGNWVILLGERVARIGGN